MPLSLLHDVFGACDAPAWNAKNDEVKLIVRQTSIAFSVLKELEKENVFAVDLSCPSNPKAQTDFNANRPGELNPKATFTLKLPRIVAKCVVAKDLSDLLSISTATYREPKTYFLVTVDNSGRSYCYSGQESLANATPLVKRYHDAIRLWQIIEGQAEHADPATHHLLFFGIRRIEIAPRFSLEDLTVDVALTDILDFTTDKDREKTRKDIFHSVVSEFLQDQNPDRAFPYLLRQSSLFARRLKEGLAIYLSEHSPEKLAEEAQAKYMELAEKLESIVSGMEAKSLSIPAAVLLAVKEAEFGEKWTTLNVIIIIATALYLVTMVVVFLSQRAVLTWLTRAIEKTKGELKDQGLHEKNPILSESFVTLERRRTHTQYCSRFMVGFSCVPLLAVIYAVFWASPSSPSSYTIKLTPTNGVQIIQSATSQSVSGMSVTNIRPITNLPSTTSSNSHAVTNAPAVTKGQKAP